MCLCVRVGGGMGELLVNINHLITHLSKYRKRNSLHNKEIMVCKVFLTLYEKQNVKLKKNKIVHLYQANGQIKINCNQVN